MGTEAEATPFTPREPADQSSSAVVRPLRQSFVSYTSFDQGMGAWELKFWMPNDRAVRAKTRGSPTDPSNKVLQIYADGLDDDGIFFLQTIVSADIEGGISKCGVSWWFTLPSDSIINQWPRVAYIGKPMDLAQQGTQRLFHYFNGRDGLVQTANRPHWYGHTYRQIFSEPLDEVMICIGWKINWESERTFLLDDIILAGK